MTTLKFNTSVSERTTFAKRQAKTEKKQLTHTNKKSSYNSYLKTM